MNAIVGKNGTRWNARATIDFDEPEQVKQLAYVLLEQRNDMYEALKILVDLYGKRTGRTDSLADKERQNSEIYNAMSVLAKARGESCNNK